MNNHEEEQEKEERKVFEQFFEAKEGIRAFWINGTKTPSGNNIYTYEHRKPNEPDILLHKPDGSVVAFELVEILDESLGGLEGLHFKTQKHIRNYHDNLNPNKKALFDLKFKNALLFFRFSPHSNSGQRKKIISSIFNELLKLENEFTGDALKEDPVFGKILDSVHISRGKFNGPILDVESIGGFDDAIVSRIKEKFEKEYDTPYPIELLMYIDKNPLPSKILTEILQEDLKNRPKPFLFQNIWVFDNRKNEIVFCCNRVGIENEALIADY